MWVQSLGEEDPLEEGIANHSSILAWRIPIDRGAQWATVHGGHKRVRHDRATKHSIVYGLYYLHDFYVNSKIFT